MLIGDDDDYDGALEETYGAPEEEDAPVQTDASSDVADEEVAAADIRPEDFATLLPLVTELVQAHREDKPQAATEKLAALRREVRRVEARFAALQHATSEPVDVEPAAAQNLLRARTELLASSKRKRDD